MIAQAPKAQAAETPAKSNNTISSKASKTKVAKDVVKVLPTLKTSKGISDQATYRQGETIKVTFVFEGRVLRVWAKIDLLDPSFPETINLKNQGDGSWALETPKLTSNLNLGRQNLAITAENSNGTNVFSFPLVLEEKVFTITPKVVLKTDEIQLFWQPIKPAQKYLVQWNIKGENVFHLKVVDSPRIILANLTSGTIHEIEITPINECGVLAEPEKLSFQTQGVAPVGEVKGVQATKRGLTPSIGEGVSTVAPKIAQEEKTQEETPAPEGSQTEEEKAVGWNRLLVALAILVIAAGAAIGGYYGYEWWASRADKEPPPPKSSSRW